MRWNRPPLFFLTCLLALPTQAGQLGELLRAALDHPGIEAKRMEVRAAEETLSAETTRYFGSGEISAGWSRYEDNRLVGPFVPDLLLGPIPQDREIVRYGISYRLPVDIFDVIGAARDKARNDVEAARLAEHQQTLLKLHQVTTAWVQLQALGRQQAGLAKRYQTLGRTMERVKAEVELGKAAEVDLRLAESELARVEADRVRLSGSIRQARARLIEATGQSGLPAPGDVHVPLWLEVEVEETIPVRLQEAMADSAKARAEQVRKSLWPGVSLGGDYYEFDGADINPDSWTVSVGISLPLDMAAHQRRSAAAFKAEAASNESRAARRETARQLEALKSSYEAAVADAKALRTELSWREQVVELEAEKHRLGAQSLENLLRHERDWLETVFRLANAEAKATSAWSAARVLAGSPVDDYISFMDEGNPTER